MTTAATPETTATRPADVSFWEDLINIFVSPVDVFRRRQNKSVWPPMLFVALVIGVIYFATANTIQPVFEAEYNRNAAAQMAKNPQLTQEVMDKMRDTSFTVARYTMSIVMIVTIFLLGIVTWLVSKLVGAKTTFNQGLVVAAWAYMPRILSFIATGVQGLLIDTSKVTSQLQLTLSPARFLDPDKVSPFVMQFMGRFDLITIWVTILLAVGIYVTGRVSKGRAAMFGVLIWLIGSLPVIRQAYLSS
jgi:hypothetical protein